MSIYDAAFRAVTALDEAGVEYMLAGSLSSMFHSFPRTTLDADFVVLLGDVSIHEIVRRMGEGFDLEPQSSFEVFTATRRHVVQLRGSEFKIEFFHLSSDPFDQSRFQRRVKIDLEGRNVYLQTAEDVIVMKLRWQRPKDLHDARNVVLVQGLEGLDWNYMSRWCDEHGTREALERLKSSVEGKSP